MGYIYRIINKITNQNYIGQTTQDLYERWRQHKQKKSNCRYLKSAFNKYGIENFDFKLICIGFDDNLNDLEIYYIKKYNCIVPNGYNLRSGGNNGGKHNEETKKKISETLKKRPKSIYHKPQLGKPHTEEVKNKISNANKGAKVWNKGKKGLQEAWNKGIDMPNDTKEKIRLSKKGKPWTQNRIDAQNKKYALD